MSRPKNNQFLSEHWMKAVTIMATALKNGLICQKWTEIHQLCLYFKETIKVQNLPLFLRSMLTIHKRQEILRHFFVIMFCQSCYIIITVYLIRMIKSFYNRISRNRLWCYSSSRDWLTMLRCDYFDYVGVVHFLNILVCGLWFWMSHNVYNTRLPQCHVIQKSWAKNWNQSY